MLIVYCLTTDTDTTVLSVNFGFYGSVKLNI